MFETSLQEDREQLLNLVKERALEFRDVTLTSGKKSNYYFDGKQVTLYSKGACLLSKIILHKIKEDNVQALGGLTIGADPIVGAVAAMAYPLGFDFKTFIVRKEAKEHGKQRNIEGPLVNSGERVVIVEDVITTGGSVLKAVDAVHEAGGNVIKVVPLVDRREGGTENIESLNIEVDPVFTAQDFGIRVE
ncbi:MAG: orotate phosphoribosyltransferase [Clostridiales bacterium]|nr:orotate phosphoribosyltransferase [Clostridiales bacterium]MCF8021413.1 orotate phosphoribosyltransferase [Clostridiales bacterium]